MKLDSRIPSGPIEEKWDRARFEMKLVNPANKRKYNIIVVGSGLAGGAAAASLGELGYNVKCFCFQDSPRRAHSHRRAGRHQRGEELPERWRQHLPAFLRHREGRRFSRARSQRLPARADQRQHHRSMRRARRTVCARVRRHARPTAPSAARRFRELSTLAARPASSSCSALTRRSSGRWTAARSRCIPRTEMLDLVVIDGRARGIVTRDLVTGKIESHVADAVVLGTGGYGNVYYLSTNAKGSNAPPSGERTSAGALFANPCFTQIHPTCIPVSGDYQSKLTLMSESLRNDGRIWVPKKKGDKRPPSQIPEAGARLLSGAQLSQLRQSGSARCRVAQCESSLR